jgi:hypothetical protein
MSPRLNLVELFAGEEGRDVVAQIACDGHAVGLLATADLQAPAQLLAGVGHRHALDHHPGSVAGAHRAEALLSLGLG